MDMNIFSTSVVTCASSLGTLTIGGLAEFFVNDRPVAIVGRYLLEEADLSAVYESTSLCNVPTWLIRRGLLKSFSERATTLFQHTESETSRVTRASVMHPPLFRR